MRRSLGFVALAVCVWYAPVAYGQAAEETTVKIDGDQVSLHAHNVSLRTVLAAVAKRFALALDIRGAGDRTVSIDVEHVGLPDVVDRLVRGDYVLTDDRLVVFLSTERVRPSEASESAQTAIGPTFVDTPDPSAPDPVAVADGTPADFAPVVPPTSGDPGTGEAGGAHQTAPGGLSQSAVLAHSSGGAVGTFRAAGGAHQTSPAGLTRSSASAVGISANASPAEEPTVDGSGNPSLAEQQMDDVDAERLAREVLEQAAAMSNGGLLAAIAASDAAQDEVANTLR